MERQDLQLPGMQMQQSQSFSSPPPISVFTDMSNYNISPPAQSVPRHRYQFPSPSPSPSRSFSNYRPGYMFSQRNQEEYGEHNQLQEQLQQRQIQQHEKEQPRHYDDSDDATADNIVKQVDKEIAEELNNIQALDDVVSSSEDESQQQTKLSNTNGKSILRKNTKKSSGKENRKKQEKEEEKTWKADEIETLIRHWEDNEALYKVDHPDFLDRGRKSLILENIANEMQTSSTEIAKKMKGLRTYWQNIKNNSVGASGQATKANEMDVVRPSVLPPSREKTSKFRKKPCQF